MSEAAENFDFMELGQVIMEARAWHLGKAFTGCGERGAESELSLIHSACDHVPHIRRPVHTPRPPDRENDTPPTVGRTL